MKLFAVLLICAFACYVQAESKLTDKEILDIANKCKEEAGGTDADVSDALQHRPAAGTPGKCLRSCAMKKLKLIDDNNKMVKGPLVEMIKYAANGDAAKEALADEIAEACIDTKLSKDACEAAEENVMCLTKQFKSRGFTPRLH